MHHDESIHRFHIPVMGTSFTIDTPIRVAHYGISSVMSLIDHRMIDAVRAHYCEAYNIPFTEIDEHLDDCKALRITAYCNVVAEIVERRFAALQSTPFEPGSESTKYCEMLPDGSHLKQMYLSMLESQGAEREKLEAHVREKMRPGDIDANIMTKVDAVSYSRDGHALPQEFNDAHASLRGYANSRLRSSIVFSAGMNPRLYGYISQFSDFYPDEHGHFIKKIILKVSDYRSALIQGKFLAKKGLWVSEFRIESGLNCGGHAFASDGFLLGPIMQEFRDNREALAEELYHMFVNGLKAANRVVPHDIPRQRLSVQGGIGNFEEQSFLLSYYRADSAGWGTPFLLVPEAVCIDEETMLILQRAKEKDLYLSNVSPLGVPFNSVRGNTAELELRARVAAGKPGAACLKKHLISNTEFTAKPICSASIQFQRHKLSVLADQCCSEDSDAKREKILEKTCLCVGLGNAALKVHHGAMYKGSQGVAVCPGPNMAYYDRILSLKEMVDHIYGRANVISRTDRPHIFVKEIELYVKYLRDKVADCGQSISNAQQKYFETFRSNMLDGLAYYDELLKNFDTIFREQRRTILSEVHRYREELESLVFSPSLVESEAVV